MARKKKHVHGDGSVHPHRTRGGFQGQFTDEESKKRYTVYGKTEDECWQKIEAKKAKIKQFVPSQKLTFGQWLTEWLRIRKNMNYHANSYERYKSAVNSRMIPDLGHIPLTSLEGRHFDDWVMGMIEEGLAPNTIHSYCGIAHAALKLAVRKRLIAFNPCTEIERPRITREEQPVLTLEESKLLIATLAGHWLDPIIQLLLATGIRLNEALSLQWTEVDLKSNTIFICRNVAYVPKVGFVEGPPKTESSRRMIILPQFAADRLLLHRKEQNEKRLRVGEKWKDQGLVFPNEHGGYRHACLVERNLKKVIVRLELSPEITPHNLRHSAATLLFALGVDPRIIQEILGHSNITVTMNTYVRANLSMQKAAMQRVDTAYSDQSRIDEAN